MFDPTVRTAVESDVGELHAIELAARAPLADQRGGRRWLQTHPEIGDRWREVIASTESVVLIADLDTVVVGFLLLMFEADQTARIETVYVVPDARECGFGDALLEKALDAARKYGSARLEGEALPGDRATKNLYERAGITARLITLSTPLR